MSSEELDLETALTILGSFVEEFQHTQDKPETSSDEGCSPTAGNPYEGALSGMPRGSGGWISRFAIYYDPTITGHGSKFVVANITGVAMQETATKAVYVYRHVQDDNLDLFFTKPCQIEPLGNIPEKSTTVSQAFGGFTIVGI